jgi:hypothetical protein
MSAIEEALRKADGRERLQGGSNSVKSERPEIRRRMGEFGQQPLSTPFEGLPLKQSVDTGKRVDRAAGW